MATYFISGIIGGWDTFAKATYATLFSSFSYMVFPKKMSVCSLLIECSDKNKIYAIDVIFWFSVSFIIILLVSFLLKRNKDY